MKSQRRAAPRSAFVRAARAMTRHTNLRAAARIVDNVRAAGQVEDKLREQHGAAAQSSVIAPAPGGAIGRLVRGAELAGFAGVVVATLVAMCVGAVNR